MKQENNHIVVLITVAYLNPSLMSNKSCLPHEGAYLDCAVTVLLTYILLIYRKTVPGILQKFLVSFLYPRKSRLWNFQTNLCNGPSSHEKIKCKKKYWNKTVKIRSFKQDTRNWILFSLQCLSYRRILIFVNLQVLKIVCSFYIHIECVKLQDE